MQNRLRLFLTDQIGAAAAEMALILPLVMVLLFATFEGAYYIICEHQVVTGVRNAARYAARLDFSHYACPAETYVENPAGVTPVPEDTIKNLARTGQLSGGTARVQGWGNVATDTTVSVTCTASTGGIYVATGGNAPKVRVSARFNYPSLMGQLGFTQATLQIGASAESPVMGL
jgi:Flp pilus assembly protein TadG